MDRVFRSAFCAFGLIAFFLLLPSGCKKGFDPEQFQWIEIDESYMPQNYIEQYIKNDAEQRGLFPVFVRNFGKDRSALARFRGANFARPNEAALNLAFPGLEDWMLVGIKFKTEKGIEATRTVLYVKVEGNWRVGDSGSFLK